MTDDRHTGSQKLRLGYVFLSELYNGSISKFKTETDGSILVYMTKAKCRKRQREKGIMQQPPYIR